MNFTPTIKDVAQVASVHFTTVSKALCGNPSIPPATRDRIIAIAQRIGYRRNEVFSALSSQRQQANREYYRPKIAYLVNRSPEAGLLRRSHQRVLIESARNQAEALGYRFELLYLDKGHHDSRSLEAHLKASGIGGLILGAFEPGRAELELDWSNYTVVKIDSRHQQPAATFVSNDQMTAVREAYRQMDALGYRRIGLAVGRQDEEGTDDLHHSGLLLAQRELPADRRVPPLFFPLGSVFHDVIPLLREWVTHNRIDAIVCNWTTIRRMILAARFKCPEEVACACICITNKTPTLAGIVQNLDLVGRRVTSLLAALLREERKGVVSAPATTYVEGCWTPGASAPGKKGGLQQ